jgi:hypothetical protein
LTPSFLQNNDSKFLRLIKKSDDRFDKSIDVVTFLRDHTKLKVIEDLLFSKAQRLLMKNHKYFSLIDETTSSESEVDIRKKDYKELEGFDFNTDLNRKLWSKIILPPIQPEFIAKLKSVKAESVRTAPPVLINQKPKKSSRLRNPNEL